MTGRFAYHFWVRLSPPQVLTEGLVVRIHPEEPAH
jgi:hypothetical protein